MSPKKGRKPGAEAPETPAVAPETPETAAETPAREGGVSEIPRVAETPRYKRKVGPEEFWRACETYGITPVSRLYVYRLWPVIDRALVGIKNSYIAVIKGKACAGFGPADILRRFGSGKYQLSFNDPNRKPDTRVHVTEIELMDPEQPPILDPAELVAGHPENAGYVEGLRVKGLMREGESMNSGDAVKELAGVTRDALHMAREGAGDADKEIERALKLAAAMRPAGDEGLAKIMLQSQDRLIGLLLAERKAAPASNPLEAVNTTLTLFNKLGVRVGGGGGGGSPWADLIPVVLQNLPALVQGLALLRTLAPAGPGPAAPSTVPAGALVPDGGSVVPMAPVAPESGGAVLNPMKLAAVGQKAIRAFQKGISGDEFASGLVAYDDDGERIYVEVASLGVDALLQFVQMSPHWPALAPQEPAIRAWLADFCAYGEGPAAPSGEGAEGEGGAQ